MYFSTLKQRAMKKPFSIAIHGGAGTLLKGQMTPELEQQYRESLKLSLEKAYALLEAGGSAMDAVSSSHGGLVSGDMGLDRYAGREWPGAGPPGIG